MSANPNRLHVSAMVEVLCTHCRSRRTYVVQLRPAGGGLFVQAHPGVGNVLPCGCGATEGVRVPVVQIEEPGR